MRAGPLLGLLALSACASGPPARETRRYAAFSFEREPAAVREACRSALRQERFPVERDDEDALSTPLVEDLGFAWRLTLELRRGAGFVTVDPSLEIRRAGDFEAPRRTTRPASPVDDPSARSSGREGALYERQAVSRGAGDPISDRENRIQEVERRVHRLVDAAAARLSSR